MKKKLHYFLNIKAFALMSLFGLLFAFNQTNAQVTTVFNDEFNRTSVTPGGSPSINYTLTSSSANATLVTVASDAIDYRVQIKNGLTATPASAGVDMIMGSFTGVSSGFNTNLSLNSQLISWSFNMKHNKQSGTSLSGFELANGYGVATVIACDKLNPLDPTAKGYAVVMGGVSGITYNLVSFTGGLIANANITSIIQGITLTSFKDIVSIKVTYNPVTNFWNMYQKDEGSIVTTSPFPNPSTISVAAIGEVADTAGFVSSSLPNFGLVFNHKAENNNSFYFDNFKVTTGSAPAINYYITANSDCAVVSNWWTNQNGTGSHPSDFISEGQIFNILNSGVTIGSDWTVSGGVSKVILGSNYSLTVPANAFLNGKIDLMSGSNLTISHLNVFPTLNNIDQTSTVAYNGIDAQNVQSTTFGNLSILTQGAGATALGTLAVLGNLNIESGSTLAMNTNKITSIGTLSGAGTLKTKFSFSGALPAGMNWTYDVYYNYTSINTIQTIVLGNYKNLDTTGGPRNFPNDISVSGAFVPGAGLMTATNRITFNGLAVQTVEANFPPATALIIANTTTPGVSLSATEVIPDLTNLELAGNLNADYTENMGTLSLIDNSSIKLGTTAILVFANSSASNPGPADFWAIGKTLTIKGWTGIASASGTGGKLFVGLDNTGLTTTQLAQITFEGFAPGAIILSTGEVVPAANMNTVSNELVNFKFAPNPVTDKITLSHSDEISQVTVFNLMGQRVLSFFPNQLMTSIDMSSLNPSAYFVEVVSQGKKATIKVIKE